MHCPSNVSYSSYRHTPLQNTQYQPYLVQLSLLLIIFDAVSTKTKYNNHQSLYFVILSLLCVMICNAQWVQINEPLLPRSSKDMIPALYNGSIFLIGGASGPDDAQMTEYVISDNIILDHGALVLHLHHSCSGQCYTQFENILRIHRNGEIIVYDLASTDFINNFVSISTPNGIGYSGDNCLLSNDIYLFTIGGWVGGTGAIDTVQVLILDENIWFNGTSTPQGRMNHGCILTSDFIYVIGGSNVNSVDKIAADYIQTDSWTHVGTLTKSLHQFRCVLYDNLIYVIGGIDEYSILQDSIHTVDTIDDIITLTGEQLPYTVSGATTVIANDIIYVFGGSINSNKDKTNTWIKYELPTVSPTMNPSRYPTGLTVNPSRYPTGLTVNPSRFPTNSPFVLTNNPSRFPTLSPFVVTNNPSGTPIKNKNEATLSVNGHTYAPTVSPLPEYERTTTTTDQENTDDNQDDVDKTNVNQGLLLLIILLSVIITACCGITSFVYLNRHRILTSIAKYTRSRAADDNNNNNNINNDNVDPMCVERVASVSFDALQICSNLGSSQNTLTQSTDNSTYKMGGVTNKQHMITAGVGSEGHVMSRMIPGKMMNNRGENAHNDAMYIEEGINRDHIVVPHHIAFVHAAVNDPVIEDENEETIGRETDK